MTEVLGNQGGENQRRQPPPEFVDVKQAQPPLINGVSAVKHSWLTQVGKLVDGYIKQHEDALKLKFWYHEPVAGIHFETVCNDFSLCTREVLGRMGVRSSLKIINKMPEHVVVQTDDGIIMDASPGLAPPGIIRKVDEEHRQRLGEKYSVSEPNINVCTTDTAIGRLYQPLHDFQPTGPIYGPSREKTMLEVINENPPDLSELMKSNPYKD